MVRRQAVAATAFAGLTLLAVATDAAAQTDPPRDTAKPMTGPPPATPSGDAGQQKPSSQAPSPAAASPPATQKAAPAAKTGGTQALVVNLETIEGIVGKDVRSAKADEDMGRIVNVLVDAGGQIRAAVIDFGGFMGVGNRKVAVEWKALDFTASIKSGKVKLSLTRDQVRQAPEYKAGEPIVILESSAVPKAGDTSGHTAVAPSR